MQSSVCTLAAASQKAGGVPENLLYKPTWKRGSEDGGKVCKVKQLSNTYQGKEAHVSFSIFPSLSSIHKVEVKHTSRRTRKGCGGGAGRGRAVGLCWCCCVSDHRFHSNTSFRAACTRQLPRRLTLGFFLTRQLSYYRILRKSSGMVRSLACGRTGGCVVLPIMKESSLLTTWACRSIACRHKQKDGSGRSGEEI